MSRYQFKYFCPRFYWTQWLLLRLKLCLGCPTKLLSFLEPKLPPIIDDTWLSSYCLDDLLEFWGLCGRILMNPPLLAFGDIFIFGETTTGEAPPCGVAVTRLLARLPGFVD